MSSIYFVEIIKNNRSRDQGRFFYSLNAAGSSLLLHTEETVQPLQNRPENTDIPTWQYYLQHKLTDKNLCFQSKCILRQLADVN